MSEEKAEAPAKKGKGKLPVLIALVAVLGGGGFFAMKMKGGDKKPKVELGEIVKLEEILVNLKDPNTYARTDISLHLEKGFEKKKLEDKIDAIRDAIILKLSNKSLNEIRSLDGKTLLKREIAASVNGLFGEGHDEKESGGEEKGQKESDAEDKGASEKSPSPKEPKHKDWDADTGPVLKVYFANFATQ